MTRRNLRLRDNTLWPHPEVVGVIAHAARYNYLQEPTCVASFLDVAALADAYLHLVTHEAGAESAVKKLRMLRRKYAFESRPTKG